MQKSLDIEIFSPAKINLGLRILYKRDTDHFHEIESTFVKLNWGDHFRISDRNFLKDAEFNTKRISSKTVFHASNEIDIQVDFYLKPEKISHLLASFQDQDWKKNLIYKSYCRVLEENPHLPKLYIHLTKCIPPGAGLGGGSSNAGSILKFCSQQDYVTYDFVRMIAPKLGADVPFFLIDSSAWVTGIGEELEVISIPPAYGVLAIPDEHLSTLLMYAKLKSPLQKPRPSKRWKSQEGRVLSSLEVGDWNSLRSLLVNDFEKVAYELHPNLQKIRDAFYDLGSEYSSLTGSGSSIFGLVTTKNQQESLLNRMKSEFPNLELIPFSF